MAKIANARRARKRRRSIAIPCEWDDLDDREQVRYATRACLAAPVPLACSVDLSARKQMQSIDRLRRSAVDNIERRLGRRVGMPRHNKKTNTKPVLQSLTYDDG